MSNNPSTYRVLAAIRSRLGDLYMSLPEHVDQQSAAGEAMSQLMQELAEQITHHAPALAFRLVQKGDKQ